MTGHTPRVAAGVIATAAIVMALAAGTASAQTIYNNFPKPMPKDVVSEAFEATSTAEFGGAVGFIGAAPSNPKVTVEMVSFACQHGSGATCKTHAGARFSQPITLNAYELGPEGAVGAKIASKEQTFEIPYRPSANNRVCSVNSEGNVGYSKKCFQGRLSKITFDLEGVTLPKQAILSIAFNTSNYGVEPQAPKPCNEEEGSDHCPYDSLNIGLTEPANEENPEPVYPSVGGDPEVESTYHNSVFGQFYCDNGAGGTSVFRLDAGCWTGYQPLFKVTAAN